jgi:CheY-like chemotaxis protein
MNEQQHIDQHHHAATLPYSSHLQTSPTPQGKAFIHLTYSCEGVREITTEYKHNSELRVLLAEDFEPIRHAAKTYLESLGYSVLCAKDGVEALEIAESEPVDLLLTDIDMPRMNGIELAASMRRHHPDLPLIFLSGGTNLDDARQTAWGGSVGFIEKPCSCQVLSTAVEQGFHSLPTLSSISTARK